MTQEPDTNSGSRPKRLTMGRIAELAGTSPSTVSRVISNSPRISEEVRQRVLKVIEQTNFRPNLSARGLRGGTTGQIAVIVHWLSHGVVPAMAQGIDDIARENHLHVICCFAHDSDDYISIWKRFSRSGEVDGVVLVAPPLSLLSERLEPADCPVVLCACEARTNRKGWRNADSVSMNNEKAMNDVLSHLFDQGCRHMVYVAARTDVFDSLARRETFLRFVKQRGLKGEVLRILETYENTKATIIRLITERGGTPPHAFVCFNDDLALAAYDAVKEKGLCVPRDVAVAGFDDILFTEFLGITTIRVPGFAIGQEAARMIIARMDKKRIAPTTRNAVFELETRFRASSRFGQNPPPRSEM